MARSYPDEVRGFITENYKLYHTRELVRECNRRFGTKFNSNTMNSYCGRRGLVGIGSEAPKEERWRDHYPPGFIDFLKENADGAMAKDMVKIVNEKFGTSYNLERLQGVYRRFHIHTGIDGTFKKGHTPANQLPVGAFAHTPKGYLVKKVRSEGGQYEKWNFVHRMVWEKHNGPIPEGMMVSFKDGNKDNCDIENLMLISKHENSLLRSYGFRSPDPDITTAGLEVIRLQDAVEQKLKSRKKEGKNGD